MHRIAFFVEGYTELLFIESLIREIAGNRAISIKTMQTRGGSSCRKVTRVLKDDVSESKVSFLIVDCGGESNVKSYLVEEHESLTKNGYTKIVGVRDVRPSFSRADIPKLVEYLVYGIKGKLAPVKMILAIMELEAWFIADHSHYSRIHPNLSAKRLHTERGIDAHTVLTSSIDEPSKELSEFYALEGINYSKGSIDIIDKLDLDVLMSASEKQAPDLYELILLIDEFFELAYPKTVAA